MLNVIKKMGKKSNNVKKGLQKNMIFFLRKSVLKGVNIFLTTFSYERYWRIKDKLLGQFIFSEYSPIKPLKMH